VLGLLNLVNSTLSLSLGRHVIRQIVPNDSINLKLQGQNIYKYLSIKYIAIIKSVFTPQMYPCNCNLCS